MELVIREWLPADSISELTELIHAAYKQLADMGLNYWGSWQSEEITRQRIEEASVTLLGTLADRVIGTISLYPSKSNHRWPHYREAWHFGQFAARPDLQQSGIGSELLLRIEEHAKASGATRLALSTAEPAHHLIHYYEKRGYLFVEHIDHPPSDKVNYRSVILSKQLA